MAANLQTLMSAFRAAIHDQSTELQYFYGEFLLPTLVLANHSRKSGWSPQRPALRWGVEALEALTGLMAEFD